MKPSTKAPCGYSVEQNILDKRGPAFQAAACMSLQRIALAVASTDDTRLTGYLTDK